MPFGSTALERWKESPTQSRLYFAISLFLLARSRGFAARRPGYSARISKRSAILAQIRNWTPFAFLAGRAQLSAIHRNGVLRAPFFRLPLLDLAISEAGVQEKMTHITVMLSLGRASHLGNDTSYSGPPRAVSESVRGIGRQHFTAPPHATIKGELYPLILSLQVRFCK